VIAKKAFRPIDEYYNLVISCLGGSDKWRKHGDVVAWRPYLLNLSRHGPWRCLAKTKQIFGLLRHTHNPALKLVPPLGHYQTVARQQLHAPTHPHDNFREARNLY